MSINLIYLIIWNETCVSGSHSIPFKPTMHAHKSFTFLKFVKHKTLDIKPILC